MEIRSNFIQTKSFLFVFTLKIRLKISCYSHFYYTIYLSPEEHFFSVLYFSIYIMDLPNIDDSSKTLFLKKN